jgi:hypothetical protein
VTTAQGWPFSGEITGTPITHPEYADFAGFPNTRDVGVVILNQAVLLDTYGQLPSLGYLVGLDTQRGRQQVLFKTVGYGVQSIVPDLQADIERYRSESMLINLRNALTSGFNIQTSNNAGRGQGRGGSCFGDSGGPVFHGDTNLIVGIVSFGLNQNCVGTDFAYRADIAETLDFVNGHLNP